jgi:hypothetical protein
LAPFDRIAKGNNKLIGESTILFDGSVLMASLKISN